RPTAPDYCRSNYARPVHQVGTALATRLGDDMQAVHGGVLDGLHSSGRPANDGPVHPPGGPEPEVQTPVVLACESDTAVYEVELTPRAALLGCHVAECA